MTFVLLEEQLMNNQQLYRFLSSEHVYKYI